MLRTRVIPCLTMIGDSLVRTVRFGGERYIGDPVNTVRIFNELEVDELMLLDIRATAQNRAPDFGLLSRIADECFMPLAYGGGIRDLETAGRILATGFEKVVVNTAAFRQPMLIAEMVARFGSQAVTASVDVKRNFFGTPRHYVAAGKEKAAKDPMKWARELEALGAGELLITSMDRDGTWTGYDLELVRSISEALTIPVIAAGGAGTVEHLKAAVKGAGASAVSLGSMVAFQKQGMGVLINFPDKRKLEEALA